jgi:hypothetical protein
MLSFTDSFNFFVELAVRGQSQPRQLRAWQVPPQGRYRHPPMPLPISLFSACLPCYSCLLLGFHQLALEWKAAQVSLCQRPHSPLEGTTTTAVALRADEWLAGPVHLHIKRSMHRLLPDRWLRRSMWSPVSTVDSTAATFFPITSLMPDTTSPPTLKTFSWPIVHHLKMLQQGRLRKVAMVGRPTTPRMVI